jgi:hypothetical protein
MTEAEFAAWLTTSLGRNTAKNLYVFSRVDTPQAWVIAILGKFVGRFRGREAGSINLPADLANFVAEEPEFARILPVVITTLPITIRINERQGTHSLTYEQFLGMLLYANYTTPGEVAFAVHGHPLLYDMQDLFLLISDVHVREDSLALTMYNGDAYPVTLEMMQGFITLARWLGRNYRQAYAQIVPYSAYGRPVLPAGLAEALFPGLM